MAITISTKAENISTSVQAFNSQAAVFTAQLKERKITTSEAENSHRQIIQVFQQSMQEISNLKKEIESKTTYENQEHDCAHRARDHS